MLNISSNDQHPPNELRKFTQLAGQGLPRADKMLRNWLVGMLVLFIVFMFAPWTQNIQSDGKITTLLPEDRPQAIQANITGQLADWYVREGQMVKAGDTIAKLTEIKAEYLDPALVQRTANQRDAKVGSADSYLNKASALTDQIDFLEKQLVLKREQLDQKLRQVEAKIETQEANIENATAQLSVARIQYERADSLFRLGINARSKFEEKQNKYTEKDAKLTSEKNKLVELNNELEITRLERSNAVNATREKIAKSRSDRATALGSYYGALGETEKLENQLASYERRQDFYYVKAPQDALISEAYISGIGEIVKEDKPLVTIVPADPELAVELFVKPLDVTLLNLGQDVRLLFDGWPAIVFGGWPGLSFGTFRGEIVAIDNNTNKQGEYRILVAERPGEEPWPEQLRPGSGSSGIALLTNVPLWYEIWRQLNGFPADYYQAEEEGAKEEKKEDKAPIRSVIK